MGPVASLVRIFHPLMRFPKILFIGDAMLDKANLKDLQEKRIALANKYAQRSKV